MKKNISFDQIPKYKQFVNERDQTLEDIFRNHRLKLTDITDKCFVDAISIVNARYSAMLVDPYNKRKVKQIDELIDHVFDATVQTIVWEQVKLRRSVYMLSHAGEAEAIAQVTGNPANVSLDGTSLHDKTYAKLPDGTDLLKRVDFYFSDVRKKLISALEQALIFGDEQKEMLGRLILALPKKRALPPKPVLKKVKRAKLAEAKKPAFSGADQFGISIRPTSGGDIKIGTSRWEPVAWDDVVKQSTEEYIAIDRSPATFFDTLNPFSKQPIRDELPESEKIYGWELEQQMTHDFVNSVRQGQIDAANFNGINEFIWIAIIDDRTCANCCEWRSGLLTSEIEKTLADNPELKDHCDVTVPPAHFNCRCGLAPVAIDLATTEQPMTTTKGFDDWLNGE